LIKYKLIKYILILTALPILITAVFLIRVSVKPLDFRYISKYLDINILNEVLPKNNFKQANVLLNILENQVIIDLSDVKELKVNDQRIGAQLLINSANNINIGLSATKLLKKKIYLKKVVIKKASINASINNEIYKPYELSSTLNTKINDSVIKDLTIQNSDLFLNTIDQSKKIIFTNLNLDIKQHLNKTALAQFKAEKINYVDNKSDTSYQLNNLEIKLKNKLITGNISEVNITNYKSNIDIIEFIQDINQSTNKLSFSDSRFQISFDKIFSFNTHFDGLQEKIPLKISGNLSKENLLNADIALEFKNLKMQERLIKTKSRFNLIFKNTDNLTVNGIVNVKVFQNKFLSSAFDVNLKNNSKKELQIIHNKNTFRIHMNDIYLKANIIENQIEIENCIISNTKETYNVKGIINDFKKNIDANLEVSFKELDLLQLNNILISYLNKKIGNQYKITELISGKLKDIDLNILYKKNNLIIKSLSGKLLEANVLIDNKFNFKINRAFLNTSNNEIEFTSDKIILAKNKKNMYLTNNHLRVGSNEEFSYLFKLNTSFKKIFNFIETKDYFNLQDVSLDGLDGDIDASISIISTNLSKHSLNYQVAGKLVNFNFIQKEKLPIKLENFNGDFLIRDKTLNMNGLAKINKSNSKIAINVNKDKKLEIDITSNALASSFDFLNEYNFLKSGTTFLKMKILKENFEDNKWIALLESDLYYNEVNINQVLYKKKEKESGFLKAKYYFEGINLKKVENLSLVTNDIIMRGDIFLDSKGYLKKINILEFIRELDNYRAKILFQENDKFKVEISGSSLDIDNYFSEDSDGNLSGSISISTDKFYLNGFNLGQVNFSSSIENNKVKDLDGFITHNDKKYVNFNYELGTGNNSKFNISFNNFGLFLFNLDFSNKVLYGNGDVILDINNQTKKIVSGKYLIKNFSIKDASFLARLLQLASFTGLLEILASDGIPFSNLDGNFRVENSKVLIYDTRFEGLSLGATTEGSIDLNEKSLKMAGVLIPAYAINDIINKIPLLGQIITGIEGEGIIGFNYKAFGFYENPEYSINPFSVLTPGIIRSLFKSKKENQDNNITK